VDQDIVHQRRTVGTELALRLVQPQYCLALALGDRLTPLPAINTFPGRIDCAGAAFGLLPIALERRPGLILRLVDLAMRMQTPERVVADRTQSDDLLPRLASGLSASTAATSALRGKSRDCRSCALAGPCGFLRLALGI
jgi:hypothetical protein